VATRPEVVLLGAADGWHTARLERALEGAGLAPSRASFAACALVPGRPGVRVGGRERPPRAALVRSIPAGSFEQVTLRLGVLHALERLGCLVLNGARSIERCVDKSATSFLLAAAGVPTPPAWTVEGRATAERVVAAEAAAGRRVVCKPLFGAQGQGLRLVAAPDELPAAEEVGGVWYLQRYVGREAGWHDYRVFVVAGRPVAAMARHGKGWVTNIRQGGVPVAVRASGPLAELAVAAAGAVGAFYAGVDLIDAPDGPAVLEVNSMPAWRGLQGVSEVDVAGELAAAIADRLRG
jgi:tetrahydromethanopterin:alpha-L-glutamate ligase